MGFEKTKIPIAKLDDKSFIMKFGINLHKYRHVFNYSAGETHDDSIEYSPEWGFDEAGLTHSLRIDKFYISPNIDLERIVITMDYFNENGSSPGSDKERVEMAKKILFEASDYLVGVVKEEKEEDNAGDPEKGEDANDSNDETGKDDDVDDAYDKKDKPVGFAYSNNVAINFNDFSVEYTKNLKNGLAPIMDGKIARFYITGDELISALDSITARKINITVNAGGNETRIKAQEAKEFLREVMPKIKVELHTK